ncbi:MAG: DNA adenine methylase [Anaerolineae bacterium]
MMSVEVAQLDLRLQATPVVKWAGGKGQLLEQFGPLFPSHFNKYIEPFVGGGAVFFYLRNEGLIADGVILNDLTQELMTCYEIIRDRVDELIEELRHHEVHKTEKSYFYEIRGWDRKTDFNERSPVERAARTIFLNRTCYNGLYRVNSRGQFNVPFGSYKNPTICDEDNLRAVSQALQGVELRSEDFERCVEWAGPGDFLYLDPPYHPLSETASFTSYTRDDFDKDDQRRLAEVFRQLDRKGCIVMLSNSCTSFIRQLYVDYRQEVVSATRAISCKGDGRGSIPELVILNY